MLRWEWWERSSYSDCSHKSATPGDTDSDLVTGSFVFLPGMCQPEFEPVIEGRLGNTSNSTDETTRSLSSILARWRGGDAAAFGDVVNRYRGPLLSYVIALTGHLQDAEDIVQETLIRAHRAIHQLREAENIWFWLKRIAHNAVVDAMKRAGRRAIPTDPGVLEVMGEARQAWSVHDGGEAPAGRQWLTLEVVVRAIENLPETYRLAAVYHFLEEWPHGKIARELGIEPAAARQRISRAARLLRAALSEYENQETERHDM